MVERSVSWSHGLHCAIERPLTHVGILTAEVRWLYLTSAYLCAFTFVFRRSSEGLG